MRLSAASFLLSIFTTYIVYIKIPRILQTLKPSRVVRNSLPPILPSRLRHQEGPFQSQLPVPTTPAVPPPVMFTPGHSLDDNMNVATTTHKAQQDFCTSCSSWGMVSPPDGRQPHALMLESRLVTRAKVRMRAWSYSVRKESW